MGKKIKDYADSYFRPISATKKLKTYYEHRYHMNNFILPVIGEFRARKIHLADIDRILEFMQNATTLSMRHRAMSCARVFVRFLKRNGVKLNFDYRDITLPKLPPRIVEWLDEKEREELRRIFDGGGRGTTSLRTRALMELMLDTGLRISEACSLNKDDVNWERHEIFIKNGKGDKEGMVYFTERSEHWLKKYLVQRKDDLPALFISGRARMLPVSSRNYIHQKTKHLKIGKKLSHHIFRKTMITYLVREGVDIKSVQVLARHESERTTLRAYVAFDMERARQLHQKALVNI